jgi:hypothetical protein
MGMSPEDALRFAQKNIVGDADESSPLVSEASRPGALPGSPIDSVEKFGT